MLCKVLDAVLLVLLLCSLHIYCLCSIAFKSFLRVSLFLHPRAMLYVYASDAS